MLRVRKSIHKYEPKAVWPRTAGESERPVSAQSLKAGQAERRVSSWWKWSHELSQKLSFKHLSSVTCPSLGALLYPILSITLKCLSRRMKLFIFNLPLKRKKNIDFTTISVHPLQHLLEPGSISHSFFTLNLQLLLLNPETFLVLWLRVRSKHIVRDWAFLLPVSPGAT